MMKINYHQTFKKDYKRMKKRGLSMSDLDTAIIMLAKNLPLAYHYKDHALSGNYQGFRECHISPDWLLIYRIDYSSQTITLVRTGTHSDLF